MTRETGCESYGLEGGWAVVLSLLPEDCSPGPSEIGSGPSPASLGRKQKQLGAHLFPLHPSWSVSFDVKFPGETGLYHCQLGLGKTRGFALTGQGTGMSVCLCRGAWDLKDTGHSPHPPALLKRIHQAGGCAGRLGPGDSERLPVSSLG